MKHISITLAFCITALSSYSQTEVEKAFVRISKSPHQFTYKNGKEVNNKGGHLQGIQMVEQNGEEMYLLSGSSSTYSYYATLGQIGDKHEVIEVLKLLDEPYKHAGGFQINDGHMAIGVEDNEAKNTSKVLIYKANENGAWGPEPIHIIEREGAEKRMTAGCVAISSVGNEILIIVGDWDTKHLDFYIMGAEGWCELANSIETDKFNGWLAYQNINLIRDEKDDLYLVGLGNKGDDDIADLYKLNVISWENIEIERIESRNFGSQRHTKFRWGAGVHYDNGYMKIISCGDDLKNGATISVYR